MVAQVGLPGSSPEQDEIYRIAFDGSIAGEGNYTVVGGDAERVSHALDRAWKGVADVAPTMALCSRALSNDGSGDLQAEDFEVGFLDRSKLGRTFTRFNTERIAELLGG